jgi:hypothetical protein
MEPTVLMPNVPRWLAWVGTTVVALLATGATIAWCVLLFWLLRSGVSLLGGLAA